MVTNSQSFDPCTGYWLISLYSPCSAWCGNASIDVHAGIDLDSSTHSTRTGCE